MMQLLVYILVLPFIRLISLLPFRLLYLLSDFTSFFLYRVIRYRYQTVIANLRMVFPEKSDDEINRIAKAFYSHVCDLFLEMIKILNMSDKQLHKRFVLENMDLIENLEAQNKSCIILCGHYANWEWGVYIGRILGKHKFFVAYQPIENVYFDRLVQKIRIRFDTVLIPVKDIIKTVVKNEKNNIFHATTLISDQSPQPHRAIYWRPFMGIKVPVHTGGELLAKKINLPVLFLYCRKVKRGHYVTSVRMLSEKPRELPDFQVTDLFFDTLEAQIREKPEYYYWFHKRWKHRDKTQKKFK